MKKHIYPYILMFVTGMLLSGKEMPAQTPTHYPTGPNRVDLTPVNIFIYIVFPVLLVVIWIVVRRRKSGEKKENK
jgi:heme/copper-type cytochrome/quinol oxidase subunit 2